MIFLFYLLLFFIDRIIKFQVLKEGVYLINKDFVLGMYVTHGTSMILHILVVMFLLCVLYFKFRTQKYVVILIVVGAVSNLIDRILYNGVIDYVWLWRLPVFNFSDVLITIGILFLIILEIKSYGKKYDS